MRKEIFEDRSTLTTTSVSLSEEREQKEGLDRKGSSSIAQDPMSVAQVVVKMLEMFGIKKAFGVSGGAIAPVWNALGQSAIEVFHFCHEAGAAFAATEAYFANGETVVVFTTTGPGLTNALTGLFAARSEGAKAILISPCTSAAQRDQFAFQETSLNTMPSDFFRTGTLFDFATILESEAQLPVIQTRLAKGLAQPDGFVAHISIPMALQSHFTDISLPQCKTSYSTVRACKKEIADCAELLYPSTLSPQNSCAIWLGFGARGAANTIRKLAVLMGSPVICSPRAKGIFPENHPLYLGVSGFGGHSSVVTYMQEFLPKHVLVLGTNLGEFTSFASQAMIPKEGFIHVDTDPFNAYSNPAKCLAAIESDVKAFVKQLLKKFLKKFLKDAGPSIPKETRQQLLKQLLKQLLQDTGTPLTKETGNQLLQQLLQQLLEDTDKQLLKDAATKLLETLETLTVPAAKEVLGKDALLSTPASLPEPDYLECSVKPQSSGPVRPQLLMQAIQNVIVNGSDAVVMTEAGSSFAWGTRTLCFQDPGRYRVSTGFGSMGHAATGVVGATLALNQKKDRDDTANSPRKAVAIVGDGAMLMNSEVNTAVKYKIPAVWIVLNNGNYNLCDQGMKALGFKNVDAGITKTDFALVARAMGAKGVRITQESQIEKVLEEAMKATEPFVIDVEIDPTIPAPLGERVKSLMAQGAGKSEG